MAKPFILPPEVEANPELAVPGIVVSKAIESGYDLKSIWDYYNTPTVPVRTSAGGPHQPFLRGSQLANESTPIYNYPTTSPYGGTTEAPTGGYGSVDITEISVAKKGNSK